MSIRPDDLTPTIAPPDQIRKSRASCCPRLACDVRIFMCFGPHNKFPYAPNRPFTPTRCAEERPVPPARILGFQRGVFVQSTCHGSDHRVLVDLLESQQGPLSRRSPCSNPGRRRRRSIASTDAGVRGVRLHFYFPHLGAPKPRADMLQVIEKVSPHGWHIALHVGGHGVLDLL